MPIVPAFIPVRFVVPAGMGPVIVLLIALSLVGASEPPRLARSTGQPTGKFKRGRAELEAELEDLQDSPSVGTAAGVVGGRCRWVVVGMASRTVSAGHPDANAS